MQVGTGRELIEEAAGHYREHRDAFVAWAGDRFGAGAEEARDVFQETLCIFCEQAADGRLNGFDGQLRTYLFAVGRNILLTRFRSARIRGDHSMRYAIHVQGVHQPNAQETMEREEDLERVRKELSALGEDDRRVLELYYDQRLNMQEIAELMGYKNANVAKKKKSIALKRLMERVKRGMGLLLL